MKNFIAAILLIFLIGSSGAADFIHGFYTVEPGREEDYELLKSLGINYIFSYKNAYTPEGEALMRKRLDLAQKHGMKVMFNLNSHSAYGLYKRPDYLEKIRETVRKFKGHPAIGLWYLYDEPSGAKLQKQLLEVYAMVKEEDPNTPTSLCLMPSRDWRDFTSHADILMGDIYPIRNEPFPEAPLYQFSTHLSRLTAYNRPVIAVPQFMNWRGYPVKTQVDPADCRYPNAEELRYFFYSTLTMGNTTGVFWYCYYDVYRDKNMPYFEEMRPMLQEFRRFTDLLKNSREARVLTWMRDSNFYAALFEGRDGGQFLVTVNDWPVQQRLNRWMGDVLAAEYELEPWGSTRQVKASIANNRIHLEGFMKPWEVMVWKLKEVKK